MRFRGNNTSHDATSSWGDSAESWPVRTRCESTSSGPDPEQALSLETFGEPRLRVTDERGTKPQKKNKEVGCIAHP